MVTLDEIYLTVQRMEDRLDGVEDPSIRALMAAYRQLLPRFKADLEDERDQLLSRGGALMLVQQVWKARV
jgi:hypothetical protein